ncbi:MAG TPA: mandelate racemase/muconate lactonizing enzyme family protein [Polyangiaceae bacterium]|nr:mandelate racemase/muconate lactonizing enzyme family protein [Polyangiaceae bacterium]
MRISGADFDILLERCTAQLGGLIGNARQHATSRDWLRLRVLSDLGSGIGEACPLPGYSPDDLVEAQRSLEAFPLPSLPPLEQLARAQAPASVLFAALDGADASLSVSARFALETAFLDLISKSQSLPLHRILGGTATSPIPLSALLPVARASTAELLDAGREWVANGFSNLKVKLGSSASWQDEFAALRELRTTLPASVVLRGDANQGWPIEGATSKLEDCAALGFEFIEEPVARARLAALPRSAVPLALDESLQAAGAEAAFAEWTQRGDVRVLVLKPTTLGGFSRCLRLAARARQLNWDVVVSHCFDGAVAHAAACELALALGCTRACGLGPHAALGPSAESASLIPQLQGAWLVPRPEPGHGVNVDQLD